MNQVQVGSRTFRIGTMPPREQFHMMRRLAPVLGPVLPAAMSLLDDSVAREDAMGQLAAMLLPALDAIAALPDEQLDYVMNSCLTRVSVLGPDGAFHPIYIVQPRGAIRMYEDIGLGEELQLVSEVVKANMSGFFGQLSGASASSLGVPPAPPARTA